MLLGDLNLTKDEPEIPGVEGEPRANRRGLRLSGRAEHWPAARHEHRGHCCYRPELLQTNATTRDATHAHPPEPARSASLALLLCNCSGVMTNQHCCLIVVETAD